MRAVDTNIIVRYLVGDDLAQSQKTQDIVGHEPVFVPRTVLLEAEWVLRKLYGMAPTPIIRALRAFVGLPGVSAEDAASVAKAMDWAEAGLDFADALHLAAAVHCVGFITFDKRFACTGSRLGRMPFYNPG